MRISNWSSDVFSSVLRKLNWIVKDFCLCQCGYDLHHASDNLKRKLKPTNEERAGTLIADLLSDKAHYLPPGLAYIPPIDFCIVMQDLGTRFERRGLRPTVDPLHVWNGLQDLDRKSTRLNSSH